MKLKERMLTLAKRSIVPLALIALSLAIWFAGPLLALGGYEPLAGFGVRVGLIVFIWLVYGVIVAFRFWRRRKAQKALESAIVEAPEKTGDADQLGERMNEALATLKKSSGRRSFLYDLPWYVIIGPPGAGKTTALVNSGIKFPLSADGNKAAVAGVGGTRYCDWWFAEEAVLIDTAGRYTTQDSDAESDKKSWLAFLNLLKTYRAKQPINGVIIAISLEDLMTLKAPEIEEHATAIRKRLLELHQELKIDFPVYALFTKADLIAGFQEFFGNFPESRRRQVWGATFQTEDRKANLVGKVPAEFDDLVKRLTEETADRLQDEPDAMTRIAVFGFPAQVAGLKEMVAQFLTKIFEPTRYHANANLRGFYFSSGTQQGTPIDQILGAMESSFNKAGSAEMSGKGKSYFLHDLLSRVIFAEAGWVTRDVKAIRRAAAIRYGAIGLIALASAGLAGAWIWSYLQNSKLIASTEADIAAYREIGDLALNSTEVSDTDLENVLDLLHKMRKLDVGYANRDVEPAWSERFGLSQRARLSSAATGAYRDALERTFRSRLILRLERQIEANINDPVAVYEALKVYLMLGGRAPAVDRELIVAWMRQDWADNLYPGAANKAGRDALEEHLTAMLELDDARPPVFELNGALVSSAQQALVRMTIADRAYTLIKSGGGLVEDWRLAARGGPDATLVLETIDGSPLEDVMVPGLFTYAGFHDYFLDQLSEVAEKLIAENWVLGEFGQQAAVEEQFARLGPQLLELYRRDFVASWEQALGKVRLKRLSADKPQYIAIAAASAPTSPIRAIFASIRDETVLTREREGGADVAGGAGALVEGAADGSIAKEVAAIAAQRIQDRATGWKRIGIELALKKSQMRVGAGGEASAPQTPGANIEAYFRPFHQLVDGEAGQRPIDSLIQNLYEIYQSLLLAATNPSQTERATSNLQLQIVNLRSNASRLPTPLAKMMESAIDDFEGDAAGSTISQLNQQLSSIVTRTCQEITASRYPFSRDSGRDVPIAEFAKLFAPQGIIDRFFAEKLAQYVDMSSDPWTWKADSRIGQELSKATLREFQRAAAIKDAYFASGSPMPGLSMTFKPTTLSGNAELALLEVNGTVVQSQQVGNAPVTLTWPGSGSSGSAGISLIPELPGRASNIGASGPWALLRLLAQGSVSKSGDGVAARFVIGGREVSYKIEIASLSNPLTLNAIDEFKCPVGF